MVFCNFSRDLYHLYNLDLGVFSTGPPIKNTKIIMIMNKLIDGVIKEPIGGSIHFS